MKTYLGFAVVAIGMACFAVCGCGKKPVEKGPIPPGQYVVLKGDDLNNIALRAYGDMDLWQSLLNANKQISTRARFRLNVGETLQIPERAKLDRKVPKSVFPKKLPADYVVMPGDSLPFIAKGCYGDRKLWTQIYDANRDTLSSKVKENKSLLIAGQVLHIPAKEGGRLEGEKGRKGEGE